MLKKIQYTLEYMMINLMILKLFIIFSVSSESNHTRRQPVFLLESRFFPQGKNKLTAVYLPVTCKDLLEKYRQTIKI